MAWWQQVMQLLALWPTDDAENMAEERHEHASPDGPSYMRRADYGRLVLMEQNIQQAEQVRGQRTEHQLFLQYQRERFKQRGIMLRGERQAAQAAITGRIDGCRAEAAYVGNVLRSRQAALRERRQEQEQEWAHHGRELTEKYSTQGNQQLVRSLKEEIATEKEAKATEMKRLLKRLKKETDDDIHEVNAERVRRVYAETAHPVIRTSKQNMYVNRLCKADGVRDDVESWKRSRAENESRYISRAHAINEDISRSKEENSVLAEKKRRAERAAAAWANTVRRHEMRAQHAAAAAAIQEENRTLRNSIEFGRLIPAIEVANRLASSSRPRDGGEDVFVMLTRVFGFRTTRAPAAEVSVATV